MGTMAVISQFYYHNLVHIVRQQSDCCARCSSSCASCSCTSCASCALLRSCYTLPAGSRPLCRRRCTRALPGPKGGHGSAAAEIDPRPAQGAVHRFRTGGIPVQSRPSDQLRALLCQRRWCCPVGCGLGGESPHSLYSSAQLSM